MAAAVITNTKVVAWLGAIASGLTIYLVGLVLVVEKRKERT